MNAMVVGADRVGNIPDVLAALGISIIQHISGRHAAHQRKQTGLPRNIDVLILFTDFLGHNVMRQFRSIAQAEGVPVVACRRSASCLVQSVERCLASKGEGAPCAGCPRRS